MRNAQTARPRARAPKPQQKPTRSKALELCQGLGAVWFEVILQLQGWAFVGLRFSGSVLVSACAPKTCDFSVPDPTKSAHFKLPNSPSKSTAIAALAMAVRIRRAGKLIACRFGSSMFLSVLDLLVVEARRVCAVVQVGWFHSRFWHLLGYFTDSRFSRG